MTQPESSTKAPAKRTRKKPVVEEAPKPVIEVPLYDTIPEITVVPITQNTLHIVMALIQQKGFMPQKEDIVEFIAGVYKYSVAVNKNAVIIINKSRLTCIPSFLDADTVSNYLIDETTWLRALNEAQIKMYKVTNVDNKTALFNQIARSIIMRYPNKTAFENRGTLIIKATSDASTVIAANEKNIDWISPLDNYTIVRRKGTHDYFAIHQLFFTDYEYPLVGINVVSGSYWRFNSYDLGTLEVVQYVSDLSTAQIEFSTKIERKYIKSYLREQIRTRYFMPQPNRHNNKNIVVDSYLPHRLYHQGTDSNSFGGIYSVGFASSDERHYAVSRLAADVLGATPISIENMCKAVGYTKKSIKELLTKVKDRKIVPVFVGIGGTGTNTLYWLNELCAFANVFDIFKNRIDIYEPETIEVSNMLRFPMPLSAYSIPSSGAPYKVTLAKSLTSNLTRNLNTSLKYMDRNILNQYMYGDKVMDGIVFYGAPDIKSRELLSPTGRFIAATHANNSCSLWLNPIQNSDIQVESYGLIQLNTFFMNQFRMAIAFLELLAEFTVTETLATDTRAFSFSFDGIPKLALDRNYYWHISDNLQMTPEL